MIDNAVINLDSLKKLCNNYFEAYNSKNLDETNNAINEILETITKLSVVDENEDVNIQIIKWIDSLPENESELKFFLMDFIESSKDNAESAVNVKKNLLDLIGVIVDKRFNHNIDIDNINEFENFNEEIHTLLDDGILHVADEISEEIQEIYDNEEVVDFILGFLNEFLIDKICKKFILDKVESNVDDKKVIHYTTYFMPILINADNKILELPSVKEIESIVKKEFKKRSVLGKAKIQMNSFVLEAPNLMQIKYEQINDLIVDGLISTEGFYNDKIKEFRDNKISFRGDCKELYLGISLVQNGLESEYEKFEEVESIFNKLINDEHFLIELSKKLKSVHSTFQLLPPVEWGNQEVFIRSVNALLNLFNFLNEAKTNSEIIYSESLDENCFYMFAVNDSCRSLEKAIAIYLPLQKLRTMFYEMISEFSETYNVAVYKYNEKMDVARFKREHQYDNFNKLIEDCSLINSEWKSWKSINYLPQVNTIQ